MKCIVGLGNPGTEYEHTRHNVGFLMVDLLREAWGLPPWQDSRFYGVTSEGVIDGEKVILMKPQTYMNLSGKAVSSIIHFYKLDPTQDLLVISDDIDMAFGKVRLRNEGSSGGQRGLESIITSLGTKEFTRIKVGIGRNPLYSTSDWVLSKFTIDEEGIIKKSIFSKILQYAGNSIRE